MRILCQIIKCLTAIISLLVLVVSCSGYVQGGSFSSGNEYVVIGAVVILLVLIFSTDTSVSTKCPKCKSKNVELESVKEIDRWLGNKKVREKMASGKIKERYINTTMVKKRYCYCCQNCQHKFTEVGTQEL